MSISKIRINFVELENIVRFLKTLDQDTRASIVAGNHIIELKSTPTGVGNSLEATILTFTSSGWRETNYIKNISDFESW